MKWKLIKNQIMNAKPSQVYNLSNVDRPSGRKFRQVKFQFFFRLIESFAE